MKRLRFFAASVLTSILLLSGSAWGALPDIVYHTMDFPNGAMGVLSDIDSEGRGGTGDIVRVNVYGDAVLYGYRHDEEDKILLVEHSGYGLGKDITYIFSPGKWDSPRSLTEEESFSWDMRGLDFDDSYFYVANLMQGRITKVRIDDLKVMDVSFDMGSFDTGESFDDQFGHLAEDVILAPDGFLYAMDQTYESYPLELGSGTVFKIDPTTMKAVDWAKVGASPWDMAYHDGYVYVSCFGGSMFTNGYKETDRPLIQRIPVSSMRGATQNIAGKDIINSENDMNGYMLLEIGSDGTIYITSYQIKDPFSSRVYIGNVDTLSSEPTFDSSTLKKVATFAGWSRASLMDRTRNLCWISDSGTSRNDAKLVAFDSTGIVESYEGSSLGGYPNMLALTGKNEKPDSSSNEPPSAPLLSTPPNCAAMPPNETDLSWERSTDPDGDSLLYRIYLAPDSDDLTYIATVAGTSFKPKLKSSSPYRWTIVADDEKGGRTSSKTGKFTTTGYSDPLFPSVPEDRYEDSGIALLRTKGGVIDDDLLEDHRTLSSSDITSLKVLSLDIPSISGNELVIDTTTTGGCYGIVEIAITADSSDLSAWDGLFEKLTAPASDQNAMRHRIVSRMSPIISIQGKTIDPTSNMSESQKELAIEAYPCGNRILMSFSIIVVDDDDFAEPRTAVDSSGNRYFVISDGDRDGKLKLSLGLGVLEEKDDETPSNYSFPSSTGCEVGSMGIGSLSLLLPVLIGLLRRSSKR
ncbi:MULTISPECIES: hypothetical protein [Dethiosulfovibrio]|uniref:Fibronectin type-III domain-containing protein n=2 Tax=Dethiosulfovibrio TaxID=47054 RepID=A0ABS9EPN4_9BACT|nr:MULTISPECIES: hypothetical protein [Dethiosulfovibrio]MCF4114476.1 hypothetical protein [Dethiosulfovibrio russensis]MCF4143153.1 hypothetical protein [Dethiosulfovibrio marinus]MCF4145747.1 hypothetical protein [Dethiosulfovibrio acidaminovorans]